jgi:hypothetical protein
LPSGYQKFVNNTYCSEPFYIGGKYIMTGGLIYSQTGTGSNITTAYKGLVYTSTDGATWAVNTFDPPATINNIFQGGRTSYAVQIGSNIVMPLLQTNTTVSGTQVSSNKQYATSTDGLAYTFGVHSGTPNTQMMGNLSSFPSLLLPGGRVGFTVTYAQVNGVSTPTYSYAYTSDGYTFTSTTDLMFTNPALAAYSPTLKRLVAIRQDSNATTSAQTGVTIGTLDFP